MDEKCHPERQKVSAVRDVSLAADWAGFLEQRVADRDGLSLADARPIVARRTGVPQGKLYSLRRKRLKDIANHILVQLGEGVKRELEAELRQVEHDLQICRQIGERPDSGEVLSLLASRQKIKKALGHSLPVAPDDGAT